MRMKGSSPLPVAINGTKIYFKELFIFKDRFLVILGNE